MSKFLDKNQTVYDIKITAYGKYLIANGKFKPHYYTFLDDNVVYDSNYVGYSEHQNETHNRIKNETEYLEGLVDFESVEKRAGRVRKFVPRDSIVLESERLTPQRSNFYYEKFIGDAFNSSDKQLAPAMKIVALKGEISSSSGKDLKNNLQVPQLNMEATYTLKSFEPMNLAVNETKYSNLLNTTRQFSDNKIIALEPEDLLIYAEELNTDLLNLVAGKHVQIVGPAPYLIGQNRGSTIICTTGWKIWRREKRQINKTFIWKRFWQDWWWLYDRLWC